MLWCRLDNASSLMIRTHMLSVLSSAVAPLYRVAPPGWNPIPISVNTLCVSEVGGSKSPIHDTLILPLRRHSEMNGDRYCEQVAQARHHAEHRRLNIDFLKAAIKRAHRSREPAADLEAELHSLVADAIPMAKHRPRLVGDMDKESLMHHLDGKYEAADFITDEGGKLLKSSLMRNHLPALIELIDGQSTSYRREKKRYLAASEPTCTFGLMSQPYFIDPYRPHYKRDKLITSEAVEIGFFARFLVYDDSVGDSRTCERQPGTDDVAIKALHQFLESRYEEHLSNRENGKLPSTLTFDANASEVWKEIAGLTKAAKTARPEIGAHVAKWMNLAARLAATLHACESTSLEITAECLYRARDLVMFHARHYERLFTTPAPMSQVEKDIRAISLHLERYSPIDMQQVCTNTIRIALSLPKNRLMDALRIMNQKNIIEFTDSKGEFINAQWLFSASYLRFS